MAQYTRIKLFPYKNQTSAILALALVSSPLWMGQNQRQAETTSCPRENLEIKIVDIFCREDERSAQQNFAAIHHLQRPQTPSFYRRRFWG